MSRVDAVATGKGWGRSAAITEAVRLLLKKHERKAGESNPASVVPVPPPTQAHAWIPAELASRLPAIERGMVPLRGFLARHSGMAERATFVTLAGELGRPVVGDELWVLAPAFVTTELKEAFAIAVAIFIPFLILDLVVGLTLGAMGLVSVSPSVVALPLKLVLFVAVDGWRLLFEGLARGYA